MSSLYQMYPYQTVEDAFNPFANYQLPPQIGHNVDAHNEPYSAEAYALCASDPFGYASEHAHGSHLTIDPSQMNVSSWPSSSASTRDSTPTLSRSPSYGSHDPYVASDPSSSHSHSQAHSFGHPSTSFVDNYYPKPHGSSYYLSPTPVVPVYTVTPPTPLAQPSSSDDQYYSHAASIQEMYGINMEAHWGDTDQADVLQPDVLFEDDGSYLVGMNLISEAIPYAEYGTAPETDLREVEGAPHITGSISLKREENPITMPTLLDIPLSQQPDADFAHPSSSTSSTRRRAPAKPKKGKKAAGRKIRSKATTKATTTSVPRSRRLRSRVIPAAAELFEDDAREIQSLTDIDEDDGQFTDCADDEDFVPPADDDPRYWPFRFDDDTLRDLKEANIPRRWCYRRRTGRCRWIVENGERCDVHNTTREGDWVRHIEGHARTALGIRYACHLCDATLSRDDALLRHLRTVHKVKV
ncbi:hypothetical protein SISNIDRAFT_456505 [Sistotremastrum niveocremeum HHB9708]|uniref:C2H2-type domain-containing protein n=1 Tax=Sistotremastrum niveocremeum HHB9708 TaxID=1314777 RepID=A0A164SKK7_9AGAM|nr:hypothetical protein SISNIDRAFT_456505 [Sistotremastrum niveocremeum HHB9708]